MEYVFDERLVVVIVLGQCSGEEVSDGLVRVLADSDVDV